MDEQISSKKYQEALSVFTLPGNRWNTIPGLTYWATAAGFSEAKVLSDVHDIGVHDRDGDILRGMNSAANVLSSTAKQNPSQKQRHSSIQRHHTKISDVALSKRVRQLIVTGASATDFLQLRKLSPVRICPDYDRLALRVQTELHLLSMFGPSDIIHVFNPDRPTIGEPGKNLRHVGDWLTDPHGAHPDRSGEIVRPNPFSGQQGTTRDGKPSFIAQSMIADYRHMVFEFDSLPIEVQCQFWAGFILQSALPLVSLVYSGNKSIHGVIRVDAPDATNWQRYRERIIALFSSDADKSYRLDPQALHPLTGTRLAGVKRQSTGRWQELLWITTEWFDPIYQAKFNGYT